MRDTSAIHIWTLRVDALDPATVAPWCRLLDDAEIAQANRFVFPQHRVQYIAAHALARAALSTAMATPPAAWRFAAEVREGGRGKPVALQDGVPAPLSFSLSHTDGLVGVGVLPGADRLLGFDAEKLDRETPSIDAADRYFHPEERRWLRALPAERQAEGFLRLWTLKEAFIKATGQGLAQDLSAFWFDQGNPGIRFTAALAERAETWHFEQRVLGNAFLAACGLRLAGPKPAMRWIELAVSGFDPTQLLPLG